MPHVPQELADAIHDLHREAHKLQRELDHRKHDRHGSHEAANEGLQTDDSGAYTYIASWLRHLF